MRPFGIVINPPGFDNFFCVLEIEKPVLVEAFIPHRSVEAFHESVLNWLPRLNELVLDSMLVGPAIQRFADELRAIVGDDPLRMSSA